MVGDGSEPDFLAELEPDLEVVRLIGRGSMASVYLAREAALRRLVAVKFLDPIFTDDATAKARFEREAQSAARIEHPNVVPVYRVGALSGGLPYLVMRYIDGRSLADRLHSEGGMSPSDASAVLSQVASALAAAHERGIVHRDVKPANVLSERASGRVLLTDFGIAAIMATGDSAFSRLTPLGQVVGNPRYMSPEQLRGAELTERADVYGLGVLGYELLTTEGPFGSLAGPEVIAAHAERDPLPISELRAEVDLDLEKLLLRCLAKDPDHRPDAADVARWLVSNAAGAGIRTSHSSTAAPAIDIDLGATATPSGPAASGPDASPAAASIVVDGAAEKAMDFRPSRKVIRFRVLKSVDLRAADDRQLLSIVAQPKRVAVLTYLAIEGAGGFKRRDQLLGVFWPDVEQDAARHALRQTAYVLRRALGPNVLDSRGTEELGINRERLWCDAVAFEAALDAGRPEEALELYAGDLLPGFFIDGAAGFERWLDGHREHLRRRASEAAWGLSADREAAGDAAAAAEWARKGSRLTPLDEGALVRLVELLDRQGDRAGAMQAYEHFAARLLAEFDAEPSPQTQALIGEIRDRR